MSLGFLKAPFLMCFGMYLAFAVLTFSFRWRAQKIISGYVNMGPCARGIEHKVTGLLCLIGVGKAHIISWLRLFNIGIECIIFIIQDNAPYSVICKSSL